MEDDNRQIICERCRKSCSMPEIRYVSQGADTKIALCLSCRNRDKLRNEQAAQTKTVKRPYFCDRCKYKFQFDSEGFANLKCPYCGRSDKIRKHDPESADTILRTLHD